MIDRGFIDRVRGEYVSMMCSRVESSKVKASQGSVLSRSGSVWNLGGGGGGGGVESPVGVSVGGCYSWWSVPWVLTALVGGGVDLVVALCFLSSLMATSLKSL